MLLDAKATLDKIIRKGRIHFYKPIQIAEILHAHRVESVDFDINDLNTYRNSSKRWRDVVSTRLVGRVSTSSQKYQDNLFEKNAIPPHFLVALAQENKIFDGVVENYIYHRFKQRLQDIIDAHTYLTTTKIDSFTLSQFLDFFERKAGLKRSVDKAFEIVVYALFSTLVDALQAEVSVSLKNPDPEMLSDFSKFVDYVLGLKDGKSSSTVPANMYRGGVTNAADRGLDIITNYGPAVQVKHLRLDADLAGDVANGIATNDIVIVCKTAEAKVIQSILNQVGLGIRGIITQDDLENWYHLCQEKYGQQMGEILLTNLAAEFSQEFPILNQLESFLNERQYDSNNLQNNFTL